MKQNPYYAILSIDDSRREKKEAIRNVLSEWTEIQVPACDGKVKSNLDSAFIEHSPFSYSPLWLPKQGEAGVWMSQLNAWKVASSLDRPLLVFEDDAMLCDNFVEEFHKYTDELPEEFDLFATFFPANQYGDFHWSYNFDENGFPTGNQIWFSEGAPEIVIDSELISRAYQGYGCVALMFTPRGADRLYHRAQETGMFTPVDCFIFQQYRAGFIDAYSPRPGQTRLADVDWDAPTTIQTTDRVDMV